MTAETVSAACSDWRLPTGLSFRKVLCEDLDIHLPSPTSNRFDANFLDNFSSYTLSLLDHYFGPVSSQSYELTQGLVGGLRSVWRSYRVAVDRDCSRVTSVPLLAAVQSGSSKSAARISRLLVCVRFEAGNEPRAAPKLYRILGEKLSSPNYRIIVVVTSKPAVATQFPGVINCHDTIVCHLTTCSKTKPPSFSPDGFASWARRLGTVFRC